MHAGAPITHADMDVGKGLSTFHVWPTQGPNNSTGVTVKSIFPHDWMAYDSVVVYMEAACGNHQVILPYFSIDLLGTIYNLASQLQYRVHDAYSSVHKLLSGFNLLRDNSTRKGPLITIHTPL